MEIEGHFCGEHFDCGHMTHSDIKLSLSLVDSVNGCILPFSGFVNRGFSSRNDDIMS